MRLTDEQLHLLVALDPDNPKLLDELRQRVQWAIVRNMPSQRGTWRGVEVVRDDKGAYSSGYWVFAKGMGNPPPDAWNEIVITPDPKRIRLQKLLRELQGR